MSAGSSTGVWLRCSPRRCSPVCLECDLSLSARIAPKQRCVPLMTSPLAGWGVHQHVSVAQLETPLYPHLPAHITRPKEIRKLYVLPLDVKCYFAVGAPSVQPAPCCFPAQLHALPGMHSLWEVLL